MVAVLAGIAAVKPDKCERMFHLPELGKLPMNAGFHGQVGPYTLAIASETAFLIVTSQICKGASIAAETCAFQAYKASAPRSFGNTEVATSKVFKRWLDKVFLTANS